MVPNRGRRVAAFVFAVLLIGYGGQSLYSQQHKITTYETTTRTVVATSIHSERTGRPSLFGDSKSYYPAVNYSYSVAGTTYRNDNVYSSSRVPGGEQAQATEFLGRYPEGKRVTIHYAADDPSKSFLSGRYTFFPAYLLVLLGLILLRDSLNPGTFWIRNILQRHGGNSRQQPNERAVLADPPSLDSEEWDDDWPERQSESRTDAPGAAPITDDRRLRRSQ
jgi:hypothetical protein